MCSGVTFIAFLDFFVVNIAFGDISKDYGSTALNTVTWVVSGYAALFAAVLAPAGRLADSIGRKPVFVWSLALFTVASLACAVAPSIGWLITARLVQGAAAGGMIPSALGLILACTPREVIPRAIATWSAAAGFSAVIGPALGGVLLHAFGWRSVFYINLPLGVLLLLATASVVPRRTAGATDRLPDLIGSLALGLGIGGIVTALTEGETWGWGNPGTVVVAVIGFALMLVTVARSRSHQAPALELAVWRSRGYATANASLGLLSASMFAWNIAAPLFATTVWKWSVLETSYALIIGAVASMAGSLLAGRLTRTQVRIAVAVLGCLLLAASNAIWASSLFGSDPNFWGGWVPAAILGGFGLGFGLTCMSTVAAATMTPMKFAGGLGMTLATRQVGGAVGVAGFAAILASKASSGAVPAFHAVFVAATVVSVTAAIVIGTLAITQRKPEAPQSG